MPTIDGLIDKDSRSRAADLVSAFASGVIDSDQFEDRYPLRSRDLGVKVIWWQIWGLYSDFKTERFSAENRPSAEVQALLERCVLFLRSDLPYEWPRLGFLGTFRFLRWIPLIGQLSKARRAQFEAAGDPDAWPFLRREHLERARLGG